MEDIIYIVAPAMVDLSDTGNVIQSSNTALYQHKSHPYLYLRVFSNLMTKSLKMVFSGSLDICDADNSTVDFNEFKIDKVLNEISNINQINLLGHFKNFTSPTILIIKKAPFLSEQVLENFKFKTEITEKWSNDIYGKFCITLPPEYSKASVQIIHPATENHIKKYSSSNFYLFEETSEIYQNLTLPYILKNQMDLTWVYNVLDGKSESESIVYRSPEIENGFILAHDYKWDGQDINNLHLLAIPYMKGLKSIRDLNHSHLLLLQNFRDCINVISEKYNIPKCSIDAYFHYPPTFYHLHVHFVSTAISEITKEGVFSSRNIYLLDVIQNITIKSDYYKDTSMIVFLSEDSIIYDQFKQYYESLEK
ncbi:m7GpppX diphosphatase-like [Gordionus sp. m RMFG-2023]|uniref:m7GpppX diphosphatase-like n=1 Tax=Gordionus sp. m RMFG-2023 TaxID=3053472 RepID=UPI0031FD4B26